MRTALAILLMSLWLSMTTATAQATSIQPSDTSIIALASDTLAIISSDDAKVHKPAKKAWFGKRWKESISRHMNEPFDTVRDKGYWLRALKHGKVNLKDTTIHYPKFLSGCVSIYRWFDRTLNAQDPAYVKGSGKLFKLTLKNNNWLDYYQCEPFDKMSMSFQSKMSSDLGLYFSIIGISLGYSVDADRLVGGHPNSKKREIGFTCARFILEYYNMYNSGNMTVSLRDREEHETLRLPEFGGLERRSWGISGYYFFNNRRYAHATAYSSSKKQLRSVGSWMAGFKVTRQQFKVLEENADEFYQDLDEEPVKDESLFDYTDYFLGAGYGYNWVLGPKWVINGTLMAHAGIKHAHANSSSDSQRNMFAVNAKARAAITFNHRGLFVSLQSYFDSHLFNTTEYKYKSNIFDLTANIGVKF
ncbi:MAG: DUF4421 family protein [Muribaculaceae bacterium]|nr:DUF4421 family protein [Muribaculaceae bacterium]